MASHEITVRDAYESRADRKDDLTLLPTIDDECISGHLAKRHADGEMYTGIGDVLVAVNPYDELSKAGLGVYSPEVAWHYFKTEQIGLAPHIFKVSADAYGHLCGRREDVCVIVTGESGAGKTESAKHIMQFVSIVSPDSDNPLFAKEGGQGKGRHVEHVKAHLLNSSPLFEAIGNAKTTRNDNSSRFGKYLELQFDLGGGVVGGRVTSYLLEKSRVVGHAEAERGFHVFYHLCSGALSGGPTPLPAPLASAQDYRYLECAAKAVRGVDDLAVGKRVFEAMAAVGLSDQDREAVARVLAGVLALGNIDFEDNEDGGGSQVTEGTRRWLDDASLHLGVLAPLLRHALCTHEINAGGPKRNSTNTKLLTAEEAKANTDTLAKECYKRLFEFAILTVNQGTDCFATADNTAGNSSGAKPSSRSKRDILALGVLDIYGFEIFTSNGFEQLCINFVNEKLQQLAISLTLKGEQEEYASEGIGWVDVAFADNLPLVTLIEAPRKGIFAVLDEACTFRGKATAATFENALSRSFGLDGGGKGDQEQPTDKGNLLQHVRARQGQEPLFRVAHYAGSVDYTYQGFVEKNEDSLYHDLVECLGCSEVPQVAAMFEGGADKSLGGAGGGGGGGKGGGGGGGGGGGSKKKPPSVSLQFKRQVNELMAALTKSKPHYVRCVKPNATKQARVSDSDLMLHQVQYLGLTETVKVRRAGFCLRLPFQRFLRRYSLASSHTDVWPTNPSVDPKQALRSLLSGGQPNPGLGQGAQGLQLKEGTDYVVGNTKIFIKAPVTVFELEGYRAKVLPFLATNLTRAARGLLARLKYVKDRKRVVLSQALVRGFNEKNRFKAAVSCVLLACKLVRGLLARKATRALRAKFKGKPPRLYAVLVQKRVRGNKGRAMLSEGVREQCAACAFRAKYSKSIRDIQCAFRSAAARSVFKALKAEYRGALGVQGLARRQFAKVQLRRHLAARKLQNGSLGRKKFSTKLALARAEEEVDEVVTMLTRFGYDVLKHPTVKGQPKATAKGKPLPAASGPGAPSALGGGKAADVANGTTLAGGGEEGDLGQEDSGNAKKTKKKKKENAKSGGAGPKAKKLFLTTIDPPSSSGGGGGGGGEDNAGSKKPAPSFQSCELSWASDAFFKTVWGKTTTLSLSSVATVVLPTVDSADQKGPSTSPSGLEAFAKFGSEDRLGRYAVLVQEGKDAAKAAHFPFEFGSEWSRGRFLRALAKLGREEERGSQGAFDVLPNPFAGPRSRPTTTGAPVLPLPPPSLAALVPEGPTNASSPPDPPVGESAEADEGTAGGRNAGTGV